MAEKDDAKAKGHKLAWLAKPDVWRISTVKLLLALILLFAVTPFVENLPNGDFVESGLVTLVMIAALIAVGRDPRVFISAAVLLVPAIASKWLNHFFPSHVSSLYFPAFAMAFFGFTIYRILRFILQTAHVDLEVLSAGIVVYLMLGMLWAEAYILLAQVDFDAFRFPLIGHSNSRMNGFNAFYFSFSALTTVGFGDITPLSKVARTLAVMEAVTGTLYLAILISRLVGMYSPTARTDLPEDSDKP
jgi:voltage-gated potassium channel